MTSSDVHDLSCLLSSVLPKWIRYKMLTINLILFWTGTRLPLYWTGGGQKNPNQVNYAIWCLTTMKLGLEYSIGQELFKTAKISDVISIVQI